MGAEAVIRTEGKKIFQGRVVSDKMDKTIVVLVEGRKMDPLYKKYLSISRKLKAHDETNDARVGDIVRVVESRPISKDKVWRLFEIVERAR